MYISHFLLERLESTCRWFAAFNVLNIRQHAGVASQERSNCLNTFMVPHMAARCASAESFTCREARSLTRKNPAESESWVEGEPRNKIRIHLITTDGNALDHE